MTELLFISLLFTVNSSFAAQQISLPVLTDVTNAIPSSTVAPLVFPVQDYDPQDMSTEQASVPVLDAAGISPISEDLVPSPSPEGTPEGLVLDENAAIKQDFPTTLLASNSLGDNIIAPEIHPNMLPPISLLGTFPPDSQFPVMQPSLLGGLENLPHLSSTLPTSLPPLSSALPSSLPPLTSTLQTSLAFPTFASSSELPNTTSWLSDSTTSVAADIPNLPALPQLGSEQHFGDIGNMLPLQPPAVVKTETSLLDPRLQPNHVTDQVGTTTPVQDEEKAVRPLDILATLLSKSRQTKPLEETLISPKLEPKQSERPLTTFIGTLFPALGDSLKAAQPQQGGLFEKAGFSTPERPEPIGLAEQLKRQERASLSSGIVPELEGTNVFQDKPIYGRYPSNLYDEEDEFLYSSKSPKDSLLQNSTKLGGDENLALVTDLEGQLMPKPELDDENVFDNRSPRTRFLEGDDFSTGKRLTIFDERKKQRGHTEEPVMPDYLRKRRRPRSHSPDDEIPETVSEHKSRRRSSRHSPGKTSHEGSLSPSPSPFSGGDSPRTTFLKQLSRQSREQSRSRSPSRSRSRSPSRSRTPEAELEQLNRSPGTPPMNDAFFYNDRRSPTPELDSRPDFPIPEPPLYYQQSGPHPIAVPQPIPGHEMDNPFSITQTPVAIRPNFLPEAAPPGFPAPMHVRPPIPPNNFDLGQGHPPGIPHMERRIDFPDPSGTYIPTADPERDFKYSTALVPHLEIPQDHRPERPSQHLPYKNEYPQQKFDMQEEVKLRKPEKDFDCSQHLPHKIEYLQQKRFDIQEETKPSKAEKDFDHSQHLSYKHDYPQQRFDMQKEVKRSKTGKDFNISQHLSYMNEYPQQRFDIKAEVKPNKAEKDFGLSQNVPYKNEYQQQRFNLREEAKPSETEKDFDPDSEYLPEHPLEDNDSQPDYESVKQLSQNSQMEPESDHMVGFKPEPDITPTQSPERFDEPHHTFRPDLFANHPPPPFSTGMDHPKFRPDFEEAVENPVIPSRKLSNSSDGATLKHESDDNLLDPMSSPSTNIEEDKKGLTDKRDASQRQELHKNLGDTIKYSSSAPSIRLERPPFERPPFERPPFERPSFERPPFERPPFERPPFQRPPFQRSPFQRPRLQRPSFERTITPDSRPSVSLHNGLTPLRLSETESTFARSPGPRPFRKPNFIRNETFPNPRTPDQVRFRPMSRFPRPRAPFRPDLPPMFRQRPPGRPPFGPRVSPVFPNRRPMF